MAIDELKYPIGKLHFIDFEEEELIAKVETIRSFPSKISELTKNLSDSDLVKSYRVGGWNIKQIVHHCADSHMNAFIRFKLALTEDAPVIKPYKEAAWASMIDYEMPIHSSLKLLQGLHQRWSSLLQSMDNLALTKSYFHPEDNKEVNLWNAIQTYDWHCKHHLKHIELALQH